MCTCRCLLMIVNSWMKYKFQVSHGLWNRVKEIGSPASRTLSSGQVEPFKKSVIHVSYKRTTLLKRCSSSERILQASLYLALETEVYGSLDWRCWRTGQSRSASTRHPHNTWRRLRQVSPWRRPSRPWCWGRRRHSNYTPGPYYSSFCSTFKFPRLPPFF